MNFSQFNQWLSHTYDSHAPVMIYLLHKGARRPHFKIDGAVIKKPFPIEALGEALRERLGHPRKGGAPIGVDLDLKTNTLRSEDREAHLTHIEATLLAYLHIVRYAPSARTTGTTRFLPPAPQSGPAR